MNVSNISILPTIRLVSSLIAVKTFSLLKYHLDSQSSHFLTLTTLKFSCHYTSPACEESIWLCCYFYFHFLAGLTTDNSSILWFNLSLNPFSFQVLLLFSFIHWNMTFSLLANLTLINGGCILGWLGTRFHFFRQSLIFEVREISWLLNLERHILARSLCWPLSSWVLCLQGLMSWILSYWWRLRLLRTCLI